MSYYNENTGIYKVKYMNERGKKCTVTYEADSKSEAQKMFNFDKEPGEKLLSVKKIG